MRIGIAGFLHESNTFMPERTELRHFEEAFLHRGAELLPIWRDAHHELGGFIAGCESEHVEMVPLIAAMATPYGRVTDDAYEAILAELTESLRTANIDGLLLALHGAMVTEQHASADSETLRRVRAVIGDDMPLVVSLDMHANIEPPMAALPDATVAYRTYPHVDQRERGLECATLIVQCVRGAARPAQAHCKVPMLIHIVQQYTGAGAMAELMAEVHRTATQPGILSASLAPGYIYADVPGMGVSVVVVADGDEALARHEAGRLRGLVYARRHELNAALPDVPTAVRQASQMEGTVCLMDCGDNIGGGGPGDSTLLVHEVRRQGLGPLCVVLFDPAAAGTCIAAGIGAAVSLAVGGKTDDKHGAPLPIEGVVERISDGLFFESEARHGGMARYEQGDTAVVRLDDGSAFVLNSRRVMPTSLMQLTSLGLDPRGFRIIIVKGVTAPRAAYEPIADVVIAVDSPGVTQAGPESFPYKHRPQPLFPLEEIEILPPEAS